MSDTRQRYDELEGESRHSLIFMLIRAEQRAKEAARLLQELLDAIPPRNSHQHEREHWEQTQAKAEEWLGQWLK